MSAGPLMAGLSLARRVSAVPVVTLEDGVLAEVKALRARVDAQMYQGKRVREEWLEIGPLADSLQEAVTCSELTVVSTGGAYAQLITRLRALEAQNSSPRLFMGVVRRSRKPAADRLRRQRQGGSLAREPDALTFAFQWSGPSTVTMRSLMMAYTTLFAELKDALFADVVVHQLQSFADVTKPKLLAKPRTRARRVRTQEISNLTDDAGLDVHFISQNEEMLAAWDAIRHNLSNDAQTWMVLGYHRRSGDNAEQQQEALQQQQQQGDSDSDDDDNEDDELEPQHKPGDDNDIDEEEADSRTSDSSTGKPLPTPILLSTGGGGLGAFGSGDILQSLAFKPGWLYWIYARVELDSLEDPARFRSKSKAAPPPPKKNDEDADGGDGVVRVTALGRAQARGGAANKFVLVAYCCQTEQGTLLPSMSYRLMHHQRAMVKALSHHLYVEARGRSALAKDALVNRLLAHTDGNKIIITVTVGTGASGTLDRLAAAATPSEQRQVRAPLLIRIDPGAPLRELKARIAAAYGWNAKDILVVRVQRRGNRDVMSSLARVKGSLRSEADVADAFRAASSEVAAQPLQGDDRDLRSLGVVTGEELYVQLVRDGGSNKSRAGPASMRMAKELQEMSLVERRRADIEEFLTLREKQQKFRTPMFASLRSITGVGDDDGDDDDDTEDSNAAVAAVKESPAERRRRRSDLRGGGLGSAAAAALASDQREDLEGYGDGREVPDDDDDDDGEKDGSLPQGRRARAQPRSTLKPRKSLMAKLLRGGLANLRPTTRPGGSVRSGGLGGAGSLVSASTEPEEVRVERSDELLGRLTMEATTLGARLVDEEDLWVLDKALGNGKTARVREGILLCKLDQLPRAELAERKSRVVSTRRSWRRLMENGSGNGGADPVPTDLEAGRRSMGSNGSRMSGPGDAHGFFHYMAIKVAVKMFTARFVTPAVFNQFQEEVSCLVGLNHPSIVQVLGVYIDTATRPADDDHPALMIMYELMPRGSLGQLRTTREWADMPFKLKLKMALDVARGIEYLHTRSPAVVHRDLKSDNLLVDVDFTLKIGDFGFSARIPSGSMLHGGPDGKPVGTAGWVAPEVVAEGAAGYGVACDIFSFGIVLWELVSPDRNPLAGVVGEAYLDRLRSGERPTLPPKCNKEFKKIVKACWEFEPEKRPSAADVVHRLHRLFASMF